jgi:hypothetical protein
MGRVCLLRDERKVRERHASHRQPHRHPRGVQLNARAGAPAHDTAKIRRRSANRVIGSVLLLVIGASITWYFARGRDRSTPKEAGATESLAGTLDERGAALIGGAALEAAVGSERVEVSSSNVRPPGNALRVLCRSAGGSVLPDAIVQVWSRDALSVEATSGPDGIALVAGVRALESSSVVGSADGFVMQSGGPSSDPSLAYELVFAGVEGERVFVRDHKGVPVPGARVAYWLARDRFDPAAISQKPGTGALRAGFATAGADGSFNVPTSLMERGLCAIAVAEGVTSREPARLALGEELVVIVQPAYVAYFRCSTPDFGRPLVDRGVFGYFGYGPSELGSFQKGSLPENDLALRLLGVDTDQSSDESQPRTLDDWDSQFGWVSYFGEERTEGIAGVSLRVSLPGYREWTGELALFSIRADPIIQDVILESDGTEFGIVMADIGPELPRVFELEGPPPGRSVAKLRFQPEQGGSAFFYNITTPVRQRFEIRGVPFGTYRAYLELNDTARRSHSEDEAPLVQVGPAVSEVLLDYEPLSALRLVPLTSEGEAYLRPLVVMFDTGEDVEYASLEGPPYMIVGLEAPRVRVSLRMAFDRLYSENNTPLGSTDLVPGERTGLEVRLPSSGAR